MALLARGGLKSSPIRFRFEPFRRRFPCGELKYGVDRGLRWSSNAASLLFGLRCTTRLKRRPRTCVLITRSCGQQQHVVDVDCDVFPWAHGVDSEVPISPQYLANELAMCLVHAGKAVDHSQGSVLAHELLVELSKEIGHILTLGTLDRAGRLDGLMDLSPITLLEPKKRKRELRRRLHQALDNMVRWFAHDPLVHLADFSAFEARRFAADAVARKRQLRRLCQSSVAFSTSPPSPEGHEEANVDAAAVHGLKTWSKAFKEWCVDTMRYYFLLDLELRSKWLTGKREERFRVTVLTHALRDLVAKRRDLPKLGADEWRGAVQEVAKKVLVDQPRILDVGSCTNYFGRLHGELLDVTAVDLAPGHRSVLPCDFLELPIGPPGSGIEIEEAPEGLVLQRLPAQHFDVVVMALLFSVLPSPHARGLAAAKARNLLKDSGEGLLILADTKGTVGLHSDEATKRSEWVSAVEANGFKLASDPQLHLSREHVKGRNGYWQRAFCWSFWTVSAERNSKPVPVPVLSDTRKPRALSPERQLAQSIREAKRQAKARKAALLEQAKLSQKAIGK